MSTIMFRRPGRRQPPEMRSGELRLQEPRGMPEGPTGNVGLLPTCLPMALGSSMMILLFVTPGKGSGATTWLAGGLMMVTPMSMMVGQMGRTTSTRKRRTKGERRDYLRYLGQTRRKVRQQTAQQRKSLAWLHPDPESLWWLALSSRMWERRPAHQDFAEVRIGTGPQLFAVKISPLQTKPVEDLEPMCARALRRFIHAHATVADQPVAVFLRGFAQVTLTGDEELARAAARAAVTQLFVLHSPDDLRIAVCCADRTAADWEWIKWLPHSQHTTQAAAACPGTGSRFRQGGAAEISEPLATDFDVARLLGIGDVATFDPHPLWASRSAADRLRVPIGIDEDGNPVELDIKESAQGGNGPH